MPRITTRHRANQKNSTPRDRYTAIFQSSQGSTGPFASSTVFTDSRARKRRRVESEPSTSESELEIISPIRHNFHDAKGGMAPAVGGPSSLHHNKASYSESTLSFHRTNSTSLQSGSALSTSASIATGTGSRQKPSLEPVPPTSKGDFTIIFLDANQKEVPLDNVPTDVRREASIFVAANLDAAPSRGTKKPPTCVRTKIKAAGQASTSKSSNNNGSFSCDDCVRNNQVCARKTTTVWYVAPRYSVGDQPPKWKN